MYEISILDQFNFCSFKANVVAQLQEISSQSNLVTKLDHHNNNWLESSLLIL